MLRLFTCGYNKLILSNLAKSRAQAKTCARSFQGSTRLRTPNLERAALGTAKTELGTAFQVKALGTANKQNLERRTFLQKNAQNLERRTWNDRTWNGKKSRTWNGEHFYNKKHDINFTLII